MITLPNGTQYAVASVYAALLAVSAASNASECVLITAANTYAAGDIIEVNLAWTRASARLFRVKAATSTSVTLEGFDTTSTTLFPVGGGVGSVRKITTWVPIPFMQAFEISGGDPKYSTAEFIDIADEINLPNGFSAMSVAMTIGDDPTLPHHAVLKAATDGVKMTGIRAVLPSGAPLLYNGYPAFNETPSMGKGQAMVVKCGLALQSRMVRYATA